MEIYRSDREIATRHPAVSEPDPIARSLDRAAALAGDELFVRKIEILAVRLARGIVDHLRAPAGDAQRDEERRIAVGFAADVLTQPRRHAETLAKAVVGHAAFNEHNPAAVVAAAEHCFHELTLARVVAQRKKAAPPKSETASSRRGVDRAPIADGSSRGLRSAGFSSSSSSEGLSDHGGTIR